jgi:hypothetical protein
MTQTAVLRRGAAEAREENRKPSKPRDDGEGKNQAHRPARPGRDAEKGGKKYDAGDQRVERPAGGTGALEIIRFAASNRMYVDLDYGSQTRRIEPYSLRQTRDGNVILHAVKAATGEHRSYHVDRIQGARDHSDVHTKVCS